MSERIRVAQYGIGPIGAEIARLLLRKEWAEVVGAADVDPEKAGRDLGDVIGGGHAGIEVRKGLHGDPQVVCHSTGSRLRDVESQLNDLLAAGCHVISTCEELAFPLDEEIAERLDAVARTHGVTLLGTGVNPGFVMDKLPLTLSAVCQEVRAIEISRVVDASRRREPLQRKVGAGMTPDAFAQAVAGGKIKHMGLRESLQMIASGLGITLDRVSAEEVLPVLAAADVKTDYLFVHAGQVAGVHQTISGESIARGIRISLDIRMYVGAGDPADRVRISGIPDVEMEIRGGIHGDRATAAMVVNAIPRVLRARPGLLTMDDLAVSFR